MAAAGRGLIKAIGMALALGLAAPVVAQSTDQPIDVTAAPPPSEGSVGPAQLRDFDLRGTRTRPAAPPAAPATVQPAPATSQASPPAGLRADEVPAERPAASSQRTTGAAPQVEAPTATSASAALPTLPQAAGTDVSTAPPSAYTPETPILPSDSTGGLPWMWIAALIALLAGGAFLFWSRQQRGGGYADPGRMAFAGGHAFDLSGDTAAPEAPPRPVPQPRPDPVPPSPGPVARGPVPAPQPAPAPAARPQPADDGLIVSRALKPQLAVVMVPDRAIVTPSEVMIQFDITVHNSGSAPARDVLIEAMMVTAYARQDEDIARFFAAPRGEGDRIAGIAPLGRINLKTAVRLPIDQVHQFEAGGRQLFVPLVAVNILYRSSGGTEYQDSASFLVGRGGDRDEKLAPFRIDIGPRIFRGLSARPHSNGLSKAAA